MFYFQITFHNNYISYPPFPFFSVMYTQVYMKITHNKNFQRIYITYVINIMIYKYIYIKTIVN